MIDVCLSNIEKMLGEKERSLSPVLFEFTFNVRNDIFYDYAGLLYDHKILKLPYEQCFFVYKMDHLQDVFDDLDLQVGVFAWETHGSISCLMCSMRHGEVFYGVLFSPSGDVNYVRIPDISKDHGEAGAKFTWQLVACSIAALATHGVTEETIRPSDRNNAKREARGERKLPERHVVRIDTGADRNVGSGVDYERAGPRPHYRRGHIRRLTDGRLVSVRPCIVAGSVAAPPKYVVHR